MNKFYIILFNVRVLVIDNIKIIIITISLERSPRRPPMGCMGAFDAILACIQRLLLAQTLLTLL